MAWQKEQAQSANQKMDANAIRDAFIDYFNAKTQDKHVHLPSSSLVPDNDPTLLFTNAGMVQFKPEFLGEKSSYPCAVTAQKCVRAGGKHNDLRNVGYTARHHTFFEMLGNFSFGAYGKKEAMHYAWDFLTKILKIPADRLWVTVYHEDKESEDIWVRDIGVDPLRISRCGKADNFWSMGDTGPCGPCTEIFYDHGEQYAGGPPGSENEDAGRYVEIWNLVFMQYNKTINGTLEPLQQTCVDTGMGLERIAAVMQGVQDNYGIFYFQVLLKALHSLTGEDIHSIPMRVVVDHIRSSSFMIADGIMPSNEGRGYVLRRIIRRAVRYGYKMGIQDLFFYKMVDPLTDIMGAAYPELQKNKAMITQVIKQEEQQFARTLEHGMKVMDDALAELSGKIIPGDLLFKLYDTYGFPPDLTEDVAQERGLTIDFQGFEACMEQQKEMSRSQNKFRTDKTARTLLIKGKTEFIGYEVREAEARVISLLRDDLPTDTLRAHESGCVILDFTPFYAESGGQVGDGGIILFEGGSFVVESTSQYGDVYLHHGKIAEGSLSQGDTVVARVSEKRDAIMCNHTATHLLHAALRKVLGETVVQKGSLVAADYLRFDFSHAQALSYEECLQVEREVNDMIRANLPQKLSIMSIADAKKAGAMALFSEKYADEVRVISFGDVSIELCGGTHVNRTGDIGLFKITQESSCAAGIRRIEAVTAGTAVQWLQGLDTACHTMQQLLAVDADHMVDKVHVLLADIKALQKKCAEQKQKLAKGRITSWLEKVESVAHTHVLVLHLPGQEDREALRLILDAVKQKYNSYVVMLAAENQDGKSLSLLAGVSTDNQSSFTAAELLKLVTTQVDGRGGGRPDMAQGGCPVTDKISGVLSQAESWVSEKISNMKTQV